MVRVLIVEDAPFVTEMIRAILESNKLEIAGEARDGLEAIEKYIALRPDVVLMDLLMPTMDGFSAMRKIIEKDAKAKIIVVSAMIKDSFRKQAEESGAIDFVSKPFRAERLLEAIRYAIAG